MAHKAIGAAEAGSVTDLGWVPHTIHRLTLRPRGLGEVRHTVHTTTAGTARADHRKAPEGDSTRQVSTGVRRAERR